MSNPSSDQQESGSPSRSSFCRPLSGKRCRDPGQRKSVSFNDVPIVHEVPSNHETYRSWTATDATVVSQKIQANRLSRASDYVEDETPVEEKRYTYRAAIIPDTDHYRALPFPCGPVSDSTATYTSLLSSVDSLHGRVGRVRSATENISITPLRSTNFSSRTILKPTTIAFQSSPSRSSRVNSANTPRIGSPTIKYLTSDSLGPTKPAPRSRSANVLSTQRHAASPVPLLPHTSKRNPNVRQTYGSYYMHRVLLPAHIN